MTWEKGNIIQAFFISILSFATALPDACNCETYAQSLNEALLSSSSVLEGTIEENIEAGKKRDIHHTKFVVNRAWKGAHEAGDTFTIESLSSSICDFDFGEVGTSYLVYTSDGQGVRNFERASTCSRTHMSKESQALSDIKLLDGRNTINVIGRTLAKCGKGGKGGKGGKAGKSGKDGKGGKGDKGRKNGKVGKGKGTVDKLIDAITPGIIVGGSGKGGKGNNGIVDGDLDGAFRDPDAALPGLIIGSGKGGKGGKGGNGKIDGDLDGFIRDPDAIRAGSNDVGGFIGDFLGNRKRNLKEGKGGKGSNGGKGDTRRRSIRSVPDCHVSNDEAASSEVILEDSPVGLQSVLDPHPPAIFISNDVRDRRHYIRRNRAL